MFLVQSRWDIFCRVVDNYGDVGVAWRLARQLASEHGIAVRLFVDGSHALARMVAGIENGADIAQDHCVIGGVRIQRWPGESNAAPRDGVADVVIEAFGCGIPGAYSTAMACRTRAPTWIILDYLSAESWVESHHGLPSPHPSLPLVRHFFFPGFTTGTGGLLREHGLFERRDAFQTNTDARAAFWRALGLSHVDETTIVSLFCYPEAPVAALLDAWAGGDRRVMCVVPEGVAAGALERWAGGRALRPGESLNRGRLIVAGIPFLTQDDYDRLLWASDFNFVRGEDSFIRAQWAARPLVWNAYAQTESTHALKVDAFLGRYGNGLSLDAGAGHASFVRSWNDPSGAGRSIGGFWPGLLRAEPALSRHARSWARALAEQPDLAGTLVKFVADRV